MTNETQPRRRTTSISIVIVGLSGLAIVLAIPTEVVSISSFAHSAPGGAGIGWSPTDWLVYLHPISTSIACLVGTISVLLALQRRLMAPDEKSTVTLGLAAVGLVCALASAAYAAVPALPAASVSLF
ncbi:hypothetical protein B7R54_08985 [Subtercola boreus]|uniref:Uncharacterized protein n=1 Tax=Subtercola boreus TaxID=120213 RepID=A0A3E0VI11_9MICO|nr:hypothetical protein [Subtercola boreus]RFA09351.1 hypothetical protein B7R54_08985 [Subtercola boreus]TQL53615.1 hypothetical protein FB464_1130 [Subtercola boreus]